MDLGLFHTPESTQTHIFEFLTDSLPDSLAVSWAMWCCSWGGSSAFNLSSSELGKPELLEGEKLAAQGWGLINTSAPEVNILA